MCTISLMLENLETINHHHQLLQLETLEAWHHMGVGVGSGVFSVATCTICTHYNVIYMYC